jgi:hypothetical protein
MKNLIRRTFRQRLASYECDAQFRVSEPEQWIGTYSPRPRRIRVGLIVLALMIIGLLITPVHLTTFKSGASPVVSETSPANITDLLAVDLEFTISSRSSTSVSFLGPTTISGVLLKPVSVAPDSGWTQTDIGGAIGRSGGTVQFEVNARVVKVVIEGQETTSLVEVKTANGQAVVLQSPPKTMKTFYVSSGTTIARSSSIFMLRNTSVNVGPGDVVKASLGPVDLTSSVSANGDRASVLRNQVIGSFFGAIAAALPVLIALVILLLVAFLFGRSLTSLIGFRGCEASVATIIGLSLIWSILGSLNYVVSGRTSVLILAVMIVAAVTGAPLRNGIQVFEIPRRYYGPVSPIVLGFFLYVHPTLITKSTNVGFLQTDTYDYFHLQRLFWDQSIPSAGTDWGWGLRTLDSTARSVVENTFNVSPWGAATVLRLAFAILAVTAVYSATKSLGASRCFASAASSLATVLVPLHGLWMEGYLTRELFAHQTIMCLGVGVVFLQRENERRVNQQKSWLLLGVLMAPALALVPPYMILAPALLLTTLIWRPAGATIKKSWSLVGSFLASVVPLSIINLWWMLGSDVSNKYAQAVEGIGKNIVVPFYSSAQFPGALLGVTSFHLNEASLFGRSLEAWLPTMLVTVQSKIDELADSWSFVLLLLLSLVWVIALSRPTSGGARGLLFSYLLISTICSILLLSVWESQSFFVLMWFWTLAPGLLISAFLLTANPGRAYERSRSLIIFLFLLLNVMASFFASTRWLNSPYGETSARTHFDLAADVLFVDGLRSTINSDFQVIMRRGELTGTDDDRVLVNFVDLVLSEDGKNCVNCVYDARNGSVASVTDIEPEVPHVLVIGGLGCPDNYFLKNESRSLLVCESA